MDMPSNSTLAKEGQSMADKVADSLQTGSGNAQQASNQAGAGLTNTVERLRGVASPMIDKAADQAREMARQGTNALSNAASKVKGATSQASDSLVTYTKENPVKSLLIAAASGALLVTLVKAITPSKD
jgi:ElaB/YqjD/DUF883 family membrane-anchored ribosome-binding protein